MTQGRVPFELSTADGTVTSASAVTLFGHAASFTTKQILNPVVTTFAASASVLEISSSSASDTSAGTGARTVSISGLDINYNPLTETITLTGQTAVNTVNSYLRVNSMKVLTVGSGATNAGVIYAGTGTVTAGVPAVKLGIINTGDSISRMSQFTVPLGNTLFLSMIQAEAQSATVGLFTLDIMQKDNLGTGALNFIHTQFSETNTTSIEKIFKPMVAFTAGSDVFVNATLGSSGSASAIVSAYLVTGA